MDNSESVNLEKNIFLSSSSDMINYVHKFNNFSKCSSNFWEMLSITSKIGSQNDNATFKDPEKDSYKENYSELDTSDKYKNNIFYIADNSQNQTVEDNFFYQGNFSFKIDASLFSSPHIKGSHGETSISGIPALSNTSILSSIGGEINI